MKILLSKKLIIAFVAILLCITSMKAQTPTPQSKIRDYKLKHNSLQRIKQKQSVNNSAPNFNLKINPYWQDVNAPHAINNSHISQVQIPSANVVWAHIDYDTSAYDANQFIRTADFGRTWQKDSVDTPNGYGLSSIAAVDANTCYAAMYNAFNYGGSIYKTTDGGVTWKELEQGKLFTTSQSFPDMIYFFDAQHGVAVGDADDVDTTRSEIYTTSDAGKTWQRVPDKNLPPTKGYTFSDINAFTVFQNRLWFIAGDTQGNTYMYRSDDLGKHWRQFPYTLSTPIYHFAFADKQNGLGLSFDFGTGQTYEVATRDGGKTWADKSFTGYQMGFWVTVIPFTHTFVSTISGGYTPVSGCSYSNDYGATWHLIDTSSDFQP
ncbi:MAG TPA: hypothetical protein VHD33_05965, partial [Legionellaceae bacterium]|nr:hypothetical protein [Legionellaceae bacterium]